MKKKNRGTIAPFSRLSSYVLNYAHIQREKTKKIRCSLDNRNRNYLKVFKSMPGLGG